MKVSLYSEQELAGKLASVIKNAQHWVFVVDGDRTPYIIDLEERYFSGERSKAFDAYCTLPLLGVNIFTAEKALLPAAHLNGWIREHGGPIIGSRENQADEKKSDILFLVGYSQALEASAAFYSWLNPYYEALSNKRRAKGH